MKEDNIGGKTIKKKRIKESRQQGKGKESKWSHQGNSPFPYTYLLTEITFTSTHKLYHPT